MYISAAHSSDAGVHQGQAGGGQSVAASWSRCGPAGGRGPGGRGPGEAEQPGAGH